MKKECQLIIKELKKIFPDATGYLAEASICSWVGNCNMIRYTAHASPMFCAVFERSPESIISRAISEARDIATKEACDTSDASSNNIQ